MIEIDAWLISPGLGQCLVDLGSDDHPLRRRERLASEEDAAAYAKNGATSRERRCSSSAVRFLTDH
jgi:hypothetical protein